MNKQKQIKSALDQIFGGIKLLNNSFPSRKFTIDGRLVGDIGEIVAGLNYEIELDAKSLPDHDGTMPCKGRVQIKATFQDALTFKTVPEFYLGLKLFRDGSFEEIYNGPGSHIYDAYINRKGIGKKLLRFPNSKLKILSEAIEPSDKIGRR